MEEYWFDRQDNGGLFGIQKFRISTYPTYNARDQIVTMENICDDCGWVVSRYDYTYDDRGFITGETAMESLYAETKR